MSVKIERFLEITKDGGSIVLTPSSSVYLLLPAELRNKLEEHGIRLVKKEDRKLVAIDASLVYERKDNSSNPLEVKVVYSFLVLGNPKKVLKNGVAIA